MATSNVVADAANSPAHHVIIGRALHFGVHAANAEVIMLPLAASLILVLPTFFILGWMALLWQTDGSTETLLQLAQLTKSPIAI
jgi:hypothetical protein